MKNRTTIIAIGTLIVGLILGCIIAPRTVGVMGQMGMQRGGMQQNIDAHFIEQMIPHHEGAIEMSKLALERSSRPEIKELAQDIIDTQTKEISTMNLWYQDWFGKPPIEDSHGMQMNGMEGDMDALRNASNFDQEFLRQMIVHHEMAVMMAQMLKSSTDRPEMREFADQIITSQSREIEMMRGWSAE